jgi:hypothetical protein
MVWIDQPGVPLRSLGKHLGRLSQLSMAPATGRKPIGQLPVSVLRVPARDLNRQSRYSSVRDNLLTAGERLVGKTVRLKQSDRSSISQLSQS